MTRRRGGLVGRRAEFDVLVEACDAGPVLVSGPPGSGKTALLREARGVLTSRGAPVLDVPVPVNGPAWDRFGFRAVLAAVREQYECFEADPRLPHALDEVSRLCTEDGYADPWTRFCLLHAMSTLFTRLSTTAPVTVVFDDVDRLREPALVAAPVHRAGHTVLASCRVAGSLGAAFPQVVELGPLSAEETANLLRREGKAPVAPAAERAVRRALGPLWGNPGAVVSTIADLRDRGRWETAGGRARLRDPAVPVALPATHPAFAALEPFGDLGRLIVLLASGPGGLTAEDLPFAADDGDGAKAGQAVDALVRDGLLECGPSGVIRCRVPGFATAVAETAGSGARERLRRGIAERLVEAGGVPGPRPAALARQIAGAGRELPPRPEFAEVLRNAAGAFAPGAPVGFGHLHAVWWHTGPGAERVACQAAVLRHLVRNAEYPAMAAFVAEAVHDEPGAGERAGLAVGAVLAAVHSGHPVAGDVRGELNRCAEAREVLQLADRWFAGDRVEAADVVTALLPVWQRIGGVRSGLDRAAWRGRRRGALLADACAVRDLVPVLAAVLGEDYRVPAAGPLAAYHRVCAAYAEGRWAETVAAVEDLEQDVADGLAREHARLLAAEVCGWRGESGRAAEWLARVPEPRYFPHLKTWVEAGLCYHAQEPERAFELGRRAFRAHPFTRDELGASRLLLRLAWLAGRSGTTGRGRAVVDVAETYHEDRRSPRSFGVLALVRGLAAGDEREIHTAERLVWRRGDHEPVLLSEPATRRPEAPRGWLREAYENTCAGGTAGNTREPGSGRAGAPEEPALSDTELEILELIRTGQTNRQIARTVRMSEKTVEKHLSRLFAKAGCRTRYGLAMSRLGRHPDAIGA
jgi:DNA-binding CsgD family transcriptional regulator